MYRHVPMYSFLSFVCKCLVAISLGEEEAKQQWKTFEVPDIAPTW